MAEVRKMAAHLSFLSDCAKGSGPFFCLILFYFVLFWLLRRVGFTCLFGSTAASFRKWPAQRIEKKKELRRKKNDEKKKKKKEDPNQQSLT